MKLAEEVACVGSDEWLAGLVDLIQMHQFGNIQFDLLPITAAELSFSASVYECACVYSNILLSSLWTMIIVHDCYWHLSHTKCICIDTSDKSARLGDAFLPLI